MVVTLVISARHVMELFMHLKRFLVLGRWRYCALWGRLSTISASALFRDKISWVVLLADTTDVFVMCVSWRVAERYQQKVRSLSSSNAELDRDCGWLCAAWRRRQKMTMIRKSIYLSMGRDMKRQSFHCRRAYLFHRKAGGRAGIQPDFG